MAITDQDIKDLFKALGRIEQKQNDQFDDIKEIKQTIKDLPCKDCQSEVAKKPSWKIMIPIIAAAFTFAGGGYVYTFESNKEARAHSSNVEIHHTNKGVKALKK